ncbi:hypothetical protein CUMW_255750 [Citrus unshiu]|uniref:Uncharacterized protein n=1 Tax=Citrus unshiu TaxID=55188 RepID=A0A2H5QRU9_CITUN|nr:hypothetical protein CUMW_255750 [Citrus unshiu]
MGEFEEQLKDRNVSPSSSSPPTPPSPLPISIGPGNHRYFFPPSPTPSPPFSPPPSSSTSAENLPLLAETHPTTAQVPSAFSLDGKVPDGQVYDKTTSCLKELVDWLLQRCCSCISWSAHIFAQRQKQD